MSKFAFFEMNKPLPHSSIPPFQRAKAGRYVLEPVTIWTKCACSVQYKQRHIPAGPDMADATASVGNQSRRQTLVLAAALSLGSAIALGLTRFSYALLLPAMKADLMWNFTQAGAMNTSNAVGYLIGALLFPLASRRWRVSACFMAGCILTTLLMAGSGLTADTHMLLAVRVATGVGSALVFIGGGVLAARLASSHPRDAGFVLGLYYGGAGWGIAVSALLVPATLGRVVLHGWQSAWFALAAACAGFSILAIKAARLIDNAEPAAASVLYFPANSTRSTPPARSRPASSRYIAALLGYAMFGVGYIGYMTFIIALLRSGGMPASVVTAFYVLLGLATVVSARLWSGLLDRMRGGGALAAFNLLLAIATILPVLFAHPLVAFVSGALFGATFLSTVASTTAFVRHNFARDDWAHGISVFTIIFALGQMVGPVVIGWVSDGKGLALGLVYSSAVLLVGATLAALQRPLGG
jgi:predicted MFS family arabinose efflux permease